MIDNCHETYCTVEMKKQTYQQILPDALNHWQQCVKTRAETIILSTEN